MAVVVMLRVVHAACLAASWCHDGAPGRGVSVVERIVTQAGAAPLNLDRVWQRRLPGRIAWRPRFVPR